MGNKWKKIIWTVIVLWMTIVAGMMLVATKSHAQVTPGTVNSRTLDGNGSKITSTVVGASRGLDVSIISGGGGGTVATANNDGSCTSGAASFTAIASNASRTWLAVWASPANTDDVYLKLGATATNADARFAPGQPLNFTSGRIYTGVIDAFPASGTQSVCVLELN